MPRNRIPTLKRDLLGVARFSRWVEANVVSSEVESEKWRRLLLHQMCVAIDVANDGREECYYALWDVIENRNSFKPIAQTTTNADGTSTTLIPGLVTTEEKVQKKNDVKARSMLLMALPNEHLMTFNQYKDAKTLFATIQTRFGGNEATKKTQKTLLKNKPDLDTMGFNDLYKNFKIVEQEVKGTTNPISSLNSQNMVFISSPRNTNEVDTAYRVSTANTPVSTASTQVSTTSSQVSTATLRSVSIANRGQEDFFAERLVEKITINGSDTAGYDKSKVECFNCHKMGHFARECRGPRNHDSRNMNQDNSRRKVYVEDTFSKAMVAIDEAGFDWSYMADDEVLSNMALMAFSGSELLIKEGIASSRKEQLVLYQEEKLKQEKENNQLKIDKFENASKSLDKLIRSQITNNIRKGVGFVSYNVVPPPPTGLFSPPKLDLTNSSLEEFQQPEFEGYEPKPSKNVSKVISTEVRESTDTPLVEKLVSDDKLEKKTNFPTVAKKEFIKGNQQENPVRKIVKYASMYRSHTPRRNQRNWLTASTIKGKGWPKVVNTARTNIQQVVNVCQWAYLVNAVKPCHSLSKVQVMAWVHKETNFPLFYVPWSFLPKEYQGYVDSRCSRHMTGNMSYLLDFKEFDWGYVTFGGGANRGKITGKGTLKTGKLDFEDVYFVKELKFNLFSVSQMCDKNNSILFTDTKCFVLSPDFKLVDESQVLLKVPRKNNMYSVDMKNIVPKRV
ncbi:ribonuclease H-like domain-containing protein [Tanacetum coccineum]